jgi:hypothetical protein
MELLKHAVRVCAAVRGPDSAKGLKTVFRDQISKGVLEIVYVSDIILPESFDDALQGESCES